MYNRFISNLLKGMNGMTIKEFRMAQGLSQGDLAKALEISVSSERSYEYGIRQPSAKVLAKLKEVYGVDLAGAPAAKKPAAKKKVEVKVEVPKKKASKKKAEPEAKAEVKAEAPKKAPRKKKAEPVVEVKAEPEMKVEPEVKAEPKAKASRKAAPAASIVIQSAMGGSITPEEILARVGEVDSVYVRVDENKAYWVRGEESGSVDLW